MNHEFLQQVSEALKNSIRGKFKFEEDKIFALSHTGQNSLTQSLKQFVLKNGTIEIENILLGKLDFNGSKLQLGVNEKLEKDLIEKKIVEKEQLKEVTSFSTNFLIEQFIRAFNTSGKSKDLDGICKFLGIDKKMVNMVNSPVGKMFGKFFK